MASRVLLSLSVGLLFFLSELDDDVDDILSDSSITSISSESNDRDANDDYLSRAIVCRRVPLVLSLGFKLNKL